MVPVVTHGVFVTVMVPLSEFPVCAHSIVKAPVSPGVESLFQTPFQVPESCERASFLAAVGVAVGVGRVFAVVAAVAVAAGWIAAAVVLAARVAVTDGASLPPQAAASSAAARAPAIATREVRRSMADGR